MWNFDEINNDVTADITAVKDAKQLEDFRIKYIGKKGLLPKIYADMAKASKEDKPALGKNSNILKKRIESLIDAKQKELDSQKSKGESIDVTIPGVRPVQGTKHVITQTIEEICAIFERLGFVIQTGPEIETEDNNFSGLNIPKDHPARDGFDTFYLHKDDPSQEGASLLLRSHTSPGQVRVMQKFKPPMAVIIPGKVYRPDAVDASHSFMFHQLEGLLVDENVKFSDLKGLLMQFCKMYFGDDVKMRFRPHFFPFTEPSAEVDIQSNIFKGKEGKWLEILGCGMVHPNVFKHAGYEEGKYSGLAFGLGIDRIAMLKYGIHDIRLLYENDVRFLKQF